MTTTFIMEAVDNYNSVYGPQVSNDTAPANCIPTQLYPGMSYDAVRRKIMYVAYVCPDGDVTNDTGHALWNGTDSIDAGATYDATIGKNLFVCQVDIDTQAVTWFDVWSSTSTVPASVFGDGTARRYTDTNFVDQGPTVADPRTGNVWMHSFGESVVCSLYLFRRSDDFKQIISPLTNPGQHITIRGMEDDWVYLTEEQSGVGNLTLTPRLITAAETTADYLLAYANFALPGAFASSYNAAITDANGDMWWFSCKASGTRGYKLNKFTKPSAFVYPTPPMDGGFTDVTPWSVSTGPNTDVSGYTTLDNISRTQCFAFKLPSTNGVALVSELLPSNAGTTDPNDWRLDCTYVDLDDLSFDYHQAFVTGYMTEDWVSTSDPMEAAWSVQSFLQTNIYRDTDSYAFVDSYVRRRFYFQCCPVSGGTVDPSFHHRRYVLATYDFISGSAPALVSFYLEQSWDDSYPDFQAAYGETNPMWWCVTLPNDSFEIWSEIGFYDEVTNSWWTSTYHNDATYYLNPAFTSRADFSGNASPPFLRLSFGDGPPPIPTGRTAMVRSFIGPPRAGLPNVIGPPLGVPDNTSLPTLSGAAIVGQTLSVSLGSWTGNPNSFAIQILRNGDPIGGATSSPYLIVEDDVGQDISAQVIASNGAGPSDPAESTAVVPTDAAPLAPEFTAPPSVTGTGIVGSILTGHVGTIINNPTSLVYAWLLDDSPIMGQTGLTYTPVSGDIGSGRIKFQVSASNATPPTATDASTGVTITAASSDVPLANNTALYAMLNAGVGASGGKSYILAAGDYGGDLFSNYNFSSNPIVIKGQSGVLFQYIDLSGCQGITWGPDINIYGHADAGGGPALRFNNCQHCVSDNVTMLTGAPDNTANPGIAITFRDSSFITINGTVGTLTAEGHGSGVGFIAPCDHIGFQGYSQRNINTDGMINGGCSQITVNQYLAYDFFPNVGDHPDAFQWFSTTGHPCDDIVVTNSMYFQGIGRQSQGFFGEGDGTNHTFDTCATFGGMVGSFEQSAGTNATWNNCFSQGYGLNSGGNIFCRGGTVNATMTNNISQSAGTYPPEGPYPGFVSSGNTTIAPASSATDYTRLDAFLAANPLVPGRPY